MLDPAAGGMTATIADEEVVERVLNGETALFEILMRRHNQRILRVVRSIIRSDSLAEDMMQEAYQAYSNLRQYAEPERLPHG